MRSAPGSGSTFAFELVLPIGRAPQAEPRDGAGSVAAVRVSVAEDNSVNQRVATRLLEMVGLTTDVVDDGQAAVEAVQQGAYDLVFMDLRMPEMDGLDATRRIRSVVPAAQQPRIVALTANTTAEDEARCAEAGMDGFLSKPLRVPVLRALLARLFDAEADRRAG